MPDARETWNVYHQTDTWEDGFILMSATHVGPDGRYISWTSSENISWGNLGVWFNRSSLLERVRDSRVDSTGG